MKLTNCSFRAGMLLILFICYSSLTAFGQANKLIVIDPLVAEQSSEIRSNNAGAKILILSDKGNPLQIITTELKKAAYDEIHLYLLTKPGSIIFDELNIIPENVHDYTADFSAWKDNLKQNAVITIHSAELTSVPEGQAMVNSIKALINRNVLVVN